MVRTLSTHLKHNVSLVERLDRDVVRHLYSEMKRIRMVEEAIADRYSEWKMRCPTHLCIGQEAIAAGVCGALRKNDFVVSGHRAHGHYLAKGGDLNRMLAEIYGKATGCGSGKGGSMHLTDLSTGFMGSTAIVGGTIPVGVGLGLSIKLNQMDQISVIFFGDGAVEEGVFYESINIAVLKELPVLFICENNLYSVYSPLHVRQPEGRKIHEMVSAMGINTMHGDGNNVLEVYAKTTDAIHSIRQGNGPRFLELQTYRWREHCGPNYDNDIGYRSPEEFEEWKLMDPVARTERLLLDKDIMSREEATAIEAKINSQIEQAFQFAESSPFPEAQEAFLHLFKD